MNNIQGTIVFIVVILILFVAFDLMSYKVAADGVCEQYGMNMDGEMEPHDSSIMVNSPIWDLLIRNIILPKGELVEV